MSSKVRFKFIFPVGHFQTADPFNTRTSGYALKLRPRRLTILIILLLMVVLGVACTGGGGGPLDTFLDIPDPCLTATFYSPRQIDLDAPGDGIQIIMNSRVYHQLPNHAYVALIVNGNGFDQQDYEDLADFLAANGFIAVIAVRSNIESTVEAFIIDALEATFRELELNANTPVALIGHSIGGSSVVNTAIYNSDIDAGFNIQAVVGLAPNVSDVEGHLTGEHTPAYLLIYGSQDEDVEGDDNELNEAFASYDTAGTEYSTTCNSLFCLQIQPPFERTMIYVHGAGHAGLINNPGVLCQLGQCDPVSAYLSVDDQFCIARGYTNAFLRWKLRGELEYKPILRGKFIPASIAGITTNAADYKGNLAGSPLHLSFQISPVHRRLIENFEDDYDVFDVSPEVMVELADAGDHATSPFYVRHQTNYLVVGWSEQDQQQWIAFDVPSNADNTTNFSHFSVRIGQFGNNDSGDMTNPINSEQAIIICLADGSNYSCEWSSQWGIIPPTDPQPDNVAHSVMNTISIPLNAFEGIDRANIESVIFIFAEETQGLLMFDSLEWIKD